MKKTLVHVAQMTGLVVLVSASAASAQSSSASFRMTSEALNTGGGRSSSASFAVHDYFRIGASLAASRLVCLALSDMTNVSCRRFFLTTERYLG